MDVKERLTWANEMPGKYATNYSFKYIHEFNIVLTMQGTSIFYGNALGSYFTSSGGAQHNRDLYAI